MGRRPGTKNKPKNPGPGMKTASAFEQILSEGFTSSGILSASEFDIIQESPNRFLLNVRLQGSSGQVLSVYLAPGLQNEGMGEQTVRLLTSNNIPGQERASYIINPYLDIVSDKPAEERYRYNTPAMLLGKMVQQAFRTYEEEKNFQNPNTYNVNQAFQKVLGRGAPLGPEQTQQYAFPVGFPMQTSMTGPLEQQAMANQIGIAIHNTDPNSRILPIQFAEMEQLMIDLYGQVRSSGNPGVGGGISVANWDPVQRGRPAIGKNPAQPKSFWEAIGAVGGVFRKPEEGGSWMLSSEGRGYRYNDQGGLEIYSLNVRGGEPSMKGRTLGMTSSRNLTTPLNANYEALVPEQVSDAYLQGARYMTLRGLMPGEQSARNDVVGMGLLIPGIPAAGSGVAYTGAFDREGIKGFGIHKVQDIAIGKRIEDLRSGKSTITLRTDFFGAAGTTGGNQRRTIGSFQEAGQEVQPLSFGTSSGPMSVSNLNLVLPQYYDTNTGLGSNKGGAPGTVVTVNDQIREQIMNNILGQVPADQRDILRQRLRVITSPTATEARLEVEGMQHTDVKFAGAQKTYPTWLPQEFSMDIGGRETQISAITGEVKQASAMFAASMLALPLKQQTYLLTQYAKDLGTTPDRMIGGMTAAEVQRHITNTVIPGLAKKGLNEAALAPLMSVGNEGQQQPSSWEVINDIFRSIYGAEAGSERNQSNLKNIGMGWVDTGAAGGAPIGRYNQSQIERWRGDVLSWMTGAMTSPDIDNMNAKNQAIERTRAQQAALGAFNSMYDVNMVSAPARTLGGTPVSEQLKTVVKDGRIVFDRPMKYERPSEPHAVPGAEEAYFDVRLKGAAFALPMAMGASAEWPGAAVAANYEMMAGINVMDPLLAKRMGVYMGPDRNRENGETLPGRFGKRRGESYEQSWRDLGLYYGAQTAFAEQNNVLSGERISTVTGETLTEAKTSNALMILLERKQETVTQKEFAEIGRLMKKAGLPTNKILFNPNMGTHPYLPSFESIMNTVQFNAEGTDITHTTDLYRAALAQTINQTGISGGANSERALARLYGSYGEQFSGKTDTMKRLTGQEVPGMITDRYRYMPWLKPREVYVSPEEVMRMSVKAATSYGYGGQQEVIESYAEQLRSGKTSGVFMRYPQESRHDSLFPVNIVTDRQLQQRGVDLTQFTGSRLGEYSIGVGFELGEIETIGDFDGDIAALFASLGVSKDKGGHVTVRRTDTKEMQRSIDQGNAYKAGEYDQGVYRRLIPDPVQRESFNAYGKQMEDLFRGGLVKEGGVMRFDASKAARSLIDKQVTDRSGWVPYESLITAAEKEVGSKMGMGTSYNLVRKLEAGAAMAGWGEEDIATMVGGRAQEYQSYLDRLTSISKPFMDAFQTANIHKGGNETKGWDMTWGERDSSDPNDPNKMHWTDPMNILMGNYGISKPSTQTSTYQTIARKLAQEAVKPLGEFTTPNELLTSFTPMGMKPKELLVDLNLHTGTISLEDFKGDKQAYAQAISEAQLGVLNRAIKGADREQIEGMPAMITLFGDAWVNARDNKIGLPEEWNKKLGGNLLEKAPGWNLIYNASRLMGIGNIPEALDLLAKGKLDKSSIGNWIRGNLEKYGRLEYQNKNAEQGLGVFQDMFGLNTPQRERASQMMLGPQSYVEKTHSTARSVLEQAAQAYGGDKSGDIVKIMEKIVNQANPTPWADEAINRGKLAEEGMGAWFGGGAAYGAPTGIGHTGGGRGVDVTYRGDDQQLYNIVAHPDFISLTPEGQIQVLEMKTGVSVASRGEEHKWQLKTSMAVIGLLGEQLKSKDPAERQDAMDKLTDLAVSANITGAPQIEKFVAAAKAQNIIGARVTASPAAAEALARMGRKSSDIEALPNVGAGGPADYKDLSETEKASLNWGSLNGINVDTQLSMKDNPWIMSDVMERAQQNRVTRASTLHGGIQTANQWIQSDQANTIIQNAPEALRPFLRNIQGNMRKLAGFDYQLAEGGSIGTAQPAQTVGIPTGVATVAINRGRVQELVDQGMSLQEAQQQVVKEGAQTVNVTSPAPIAQPGNGGAQPPIPPDRTTPQAVTPPDPNDPLNTVARNYPPRGKAGTSRMPFFPEKRFNDLEVVFNATKGDISRQAEAARNVLGQGVSFGNVNVAAEAVDPGGLANRISLISGDTRGADWAAGQLPMAAMTAQKAQVLTTLARQAESAAIAVLGADPGNTHALEIMEMVGQITDTANPLAKDILDISAFGNVSKLSKTAVSGLFGKFNQEVTQRIKNPAGGGTSLETAIRVSIGARVGEAAKNDPLTSLLADPANAGLANEIITKPEYIELAKEAGQAVKLSGKKAIPDELRAVGELALQSQKMDKDVFTPEQIGQAAWKISDPEGYKKTMEAFIDQVGKAKEASEKFGDAINGVTKVSEDHMSQLKKMSEAEAKVAVAFDKGIKAKEQLEAARATESQYFTEEGTLKGKEIIGETWFDKDRYIELSDYERTLARSPEQVRTFKAAATAVAEPPDEISKALGRVGGTARRILGGFGMMYMRTMSGLITSPLETGYKEGIQMERTFERAFSQQFGTPLSTDPEEAYQRILATQYGGTGYAALRTAQNQIMKKQPGTYMMGQTAVSAMGGFATAEWLMGTIAPGLASSGWGLGAAAILGIGTGIGVTAMNAYGAREDQEKTAIANATALMNGQQPGRGGKGGWGERAPNIPTRSQGYTFPKSLAALLTDAVGSTIATVGSLFDATGNQYQDNPEAKKFADTLVEINKQKGEGTPAAKIIQNLKLDQEKGNRYLSLALQSAAGSDALAGISTESLAQAGATWAKYNMSLNNDAFVKYATGLDVGRNPEQLAASMLGSAAFQLYPNEATAAPTGNVISQLMANPAMQRGDIYQAVTAGDQFRKSLGAATWFGSPFGSLKSDASSEDVAKMISLDSQFSVMSDAGKTVLGAQAKAATALSLAGFNAPMPNPLNFVTQTGATTVYSRSGDKRVATYGPKEMTATDFQRAAVQASIQEKFGTDVTNLQARMQMQGLSAGEAEQLTTGQYGGYKDIKGNLKPFVATPEQALGLQKQGMATSAIDQWAQLMQNRFNMPNDEILKYTAGFQRNQVSVGQMSLTNAAVAGDEYATTFAQATGTNVPGFMGGKTGGRVPWQAVTQDVGQFGDLAGIPTGRPLFSTSMQWGNPATGGLTGVQTAQKIWGANAMQNPLIQTMVNGYSGYGTQGQTVGGMMGIQSQMADEQFQQQQRQMQMQQKQQQMGYAFTTGVGLSAYNNIINPQTGQSFGNLYEGGKWGLEDAQRKLGYRQAEWSMSFGEKQTKLQNTQWQEQTGLARQGTLMQRGFTQETWNYNQQMREQSWGWKQEDFQEGVRFMTGRDRRLAERQMKRDTIVYGEEGDQIEKQKNQQKELWKLEDERFKLDRKQHDENLKMTEEQQKMQRKFYEENKKLTEEGIKLQRAEYIANYQLEKINLAAQAAYMQRENQLRKLMEDAQLTELTNAATYNAMLTAQASGVNLVSAAFVKFLNDILAIVGSSDRVTSPTVAPNRQEGPSKAAGGMVRVGEFGPENFNVGGTGYIVPNHLTNPWQNTLIDHRGQGEKKQIKLTINLGNGMLKTFVLDTVDQEINA